MAIRVRRFEKILSKIAPSETDKITTNQAHIGDQEMEKKDGLSGDRYMMLSHG